MSVNNASQLRHPWAVIYGGGSFWSGFGYSSGSWPMLSLIISENGLSLGFRFVKQKETPSPHSHFRRFDLCWNDIKDVEMTNRVVSWLDNHTFCSTFGVFSAKKLDPLLDAFNEKQIPVKKVTRTWTRLYGFKSK